MAETLRCYRHPDRETGVSCSECGRGLCPDCMRFAPVGIRCPEHAGEAQGAKRVIQGVQKRTATVGGGVVTKALVALNVGIYLAQLAQGASVNANSGSIFENGALYGPLVAQGDWWRLITAAFLHYGPIHLGMNMLAVWWFGRALEDALGPVRFILLYLVSGLAGSAGALLASPTAVTVGASGAIFGLMGAAVVVMRNRGINPMESGLGVWLGINLVFTFAIPGISIGGHLGGLIGGALAAFLMFDLRDRVRMPPLMPVGLAASIGVVSVLGSIAVAS